MYWLNYAGARVRYNTLAPGQGVVLTSYEGHPWIAVETSSRQCVGYTQAFAGDYHVTGNLPDPPDTDGDGLFDDWETGGIDSDGNGTIDLPLHLPPFSADPLHKDVFVEVDYMAAYAPQPGTLADVTAAFANSPVLNPDGTTGCVCTPCSARPSRRSRQSTS